MCVHVHLVVFVCVCLCFFVYLFLCVCLCVCMCMCVFVGYCEGLYVYKDNYVGMYELLQEYVYVYLCDLVGVGMSEYVCLYSCIFRCVILCVCFMYVSLFLCVGAGFYVIM